MPGGSATNSFKKRPVASKEHSSAAKVRAVRLSSESAACQAKERGADGASIFRAICPKVAVIVGDGPRALEDFHGLAALPVEASGLLEGAGNSRLPALMHEDIVSNPVMPKVLYVC